MINKGSRICDVTDVLKRNSVYDLRASLGVENAEEPMVTVELYVGRSR